MALDQAVSPPVSLSIRRAGSTDPARAVASLLGTLARHDAESAAHSVRASLHAGTLAQALGCPDEQVELVREAALMHDIGKLLVPAEILQKPTSLEGGEDHLVRLHPVLGADLLGRIPGLENLVGIVLDHHERWDGSGYPRGLVGAEIALEARIIFVADAFDAMTTARPYGRVVTPAEAVFEIERCAGRQFDPAAAAAAATLL